MRCCRCVTAHKQAEKRGIEFSFKAYDSKRYQDSFLSLRFFLLNLNGYFVLGTEDVRMEISKNRIRRDIPKNGKRLNYHMITFTYATKSVP